MWESDCSRGPSPRCQEGRHDSCRIVGTHHESEQRPEAHRRCGPNEAEPGRRSLEGGVQRRSAFKAPYFITQASVEEFHAFNTDVIAGAGNDMIDYKLALATVICAAKAKHCPAASFAGLRDYCFSMDGYTVLDPLAKPPRPFRRKVTFHKASSPHCRKPVHSAWETGERPRLRTGAKPRNRRAQAS